MLTADLVQGRIKGKDLVVKPLSGADAARAVELLAGMRDLVLAGIGESRADLDEALAAVPHEAREQKLVLGLRKLVEDRCTFDSEEGVDAAGLRRDVFEAAAAARRAGTFDRTSVFASVASALALSPGDLEARLYGDLRAAARLISVEAFDPETLGRSFDVLQAQAVLLRAVRLVVTLRKPSTEAARALFRRLKFLRLLATIAPGEEGYVLSIDGPFSLFESVTKYGLALALLVPVLEELPSYELTAEIRWGKDKKPLRFCFAGGTGKIGGGPESRLLPEVEGLKTAFDGLRSGWICRLGEAILTVEGGGVCVPDLVFERKAGKQRVYLEIMGYWSRDAVWRRVEMVEKGLREPVLFAVSQRLRVSEEVLPADGAGRLYVYKGTINPRKVLEKIEAMVPKAPLARAPKARSKTRSTGPLADLDRGDEALRQQSLSHRLSERSRVDARGSVDAYVDVLAVGFEGDRSARERPGTDLEVGSAALLVAREGEAREDPRQDLVEQGRWRRAGGGRGQGGQPRVRRSQRLKRARERIQAGVGLIIGGRGRIEALARPLRAAIEGAPGS